MVISVTINPQLEVDEYPLPLIDDIYASLGGGTLFSVLDLRHAYLQIEVEDESTPFLTINTPRAWRLPVPTFSIWCGFCTTNVAAGHGQSLAGLTRGFLLFR